MDDAKAVDTEAVDSNDADSNDADLNDADSNDADTDTDSDVLGAPSLQAAVEALLMLADEPMSIMTLAEATRTPVKAVEATVRELSEEYADQGRGFDLREVAGGWR